MLMCEQKIVHSLNIDEIFVEVAKNAYTPRKMFRIKNHLQIATRYLNIKKTSSKKKDAAQIREYIGFFS